MAKTPDRALELLEAVWKPAIARVAEEVSDMQALADKEKAGITIAPWDYRYYAEKVRKARYDLDQNEVANIHAPQQHRQQRDAQLRAQGACAVRGQHHELSGCR